MNNKSSKFHYSWVVMAACGAILFYSIGLSFNCFTVFLSPLRETLGLNGAQSSSIVSIVNIGSVVGMLAAGPLYKKVGARTITYVSGLLMAAGAFLYGFAGGLWTCYIAAIITGAGFGAGSIIPASLFISAWFEKKRGFAMGIASACTGLATIIFSPVFAWIIKTISLRSAFLLDGAIIFLLSTICFLLIRNKPADKGLFPYGYEGDQDESVAVPETGLTFKEALRTPRYYFMLFSVLVIGVTVQPLISHMSAIYTTNGYDAIFAAFMVSVYGITMLICKPLYGFLNDKLGVSRGCIITYAAILCSFVVGFFVWEQIPAFLFAILIGMGVAPLATLNFPLWIGAAFGTRDMSSIFTSYKIPFYAVGSAAATLPGIFLDSTGSYLGVLRIYLVCGIISFVLMKIVLKKTYS